MDKAKFQKLSVKDFIQDPSALRLKSIKLPRDLSLGGSKLQKKIYKPNLNVVRNKNNTVNKSRERSKLKIKQQKGKNKVKPKCVQTSGVFSEGIVSDYVPVKPAVKVRHDIPDKIVPTFSQKDCVGVDKKHEEHIIEDIKQCLEDSDSDLEQKSSFCAITWNEALFKPVKSCTPPINLDFLKCDNIHPSLHIWQLPDSFNFKNESRTDDSTLRDLPEGMIGKICVKKSGKMNVIIGKLKYELDSSSWESFNEHLVSIHVDDKVTQATILGHTQQKYLLNPEWTSLL